MKLNPRQQKFADNYIVTGNAEESAKLAGYSERTARGHSHRMLQNVAIQKYIKKRNEELEGEKVADMREVKEFWTGTMRDVGEEMKDRVKASELIARTNGAFIEKLEHSGPSGGPIQTENVINLSALSDEELTALESIVVKSTNAATDTD